MTLLVNLCALAAFVAVMSYMFRQHRAAFLLGFFLLFPLVYRVVDIVYLDLAGPVYSSQLNRYVGGGTAAPIFIFSALAVIVPLIWLGPTSRSSLRWAQSVRSSWGTYHRTIANAGFVALMLAIGLLYANFIRVGTIPLIEGMDRLEYNLSAGIVHNGAYELNFLLSFSLGVLTIFKRLNGGDYDIRFLFLMGALLLYWLLTGNRFSIFFVQFSFFLMPFAALLIGERIGRVRPLANSAVQRLLESTTVRVFLGILAIAAIVGLVLNSYYNVRNYRSPLEEIEERVLIQPVELWAATWEQVDFSNLDENFDADVFDQIVLNPIDPTRNTTVQYLITRELGYFRSRELAEAGQQYNGGYPEVHYELFGAWLPFITLPLIGIFTALFLRMTFRLLYRNFIVSSIAAIYLFFGISLHFAGGSVTFFLSPTYWLKILIFLIALAIESQILGRGAGNSQAVDHKPVTRRI